MGRNNHYPEHPMFPNGAFRKTANGVSYYPLVLDAGDGTAKIIQMRGSTYPSCRVDNLIPSVVRLDYWEKKSRSGRFWEAYEESVKAMGKEDR